MDDEAISEFHFGGNISVGYQTTEPEAPSPPWVSAPSGNVTLVWMGQCCDEAERRLAHPESRCGKAGQVCFWVSRESFFFFLVLPLYCYQPISLHPSAHMLSHVTPWTAARQAPLSMDFSRQEYWSGLPFPSPPGNLKWSSVHPPALPLLCPSGK